MTTRNLLLSGIVFGGLLCFHSATNGIASAKETDGKACLGKKIVKKEAPKNPHVMFLVGDDEYSSEMTMPIVAKWLETYGFKTTVLYTRAKMTDLPNHRYKTNLPGIEKIANADILCIFFRWRALPKEQVAHITKYMKTGKPVIGFRTTSHAFKYADKHALFEWNKFGTELGTPPGWSGPHRHVHHGHKASTDVTMDAKNKKHPILTGVKKTFHVTSWLYTVLPNDPPKDATILLHGKAVNSRGKGMDPKSPKYVDPNRVEPIAWTWKNSKTGNKVFFTTMGHPADFDSEDFRRVVINAFHWSAGKPMPTGAVPAAPNIKYGTHAIPGTKKPKKPRKTKKPKVQIKPAGKKQP